MGIRIAEIARRAGVSRSTASRVLAGRADECRISKTTQEKILTLAREAGYSAAGEETGRGGLIGVIVSDLSNLFFGKMAASVVRLAHEAGFQAIVADSGGSQDREEEAVGMLLGCGAAGLLIAPIQRRRHHLRKLVRRRIPFVLVDRYFEGLASDCVVCDTKLGAMDLVKYLAGRGHSRIAYIGGPAGSFADRARLDGYKKGLQESRLSFRAEYVFHHSFSAEGGRECAAKILNLAHTPTAIVAANNEILVGVLSVLERIGLRRYREIAVGSFDEIPLLSAVNRPVAIVSQPEEKMGEVAVALLAERIAKPRTRYRRVVLAPALKIFGPGGRSSALPLGGAGPAKARGR